MLSRMLSTYSKHVKRRGAVGRRDLDHVQEACILSGYMKADAGAVLTLRAHSAALVVC